MMLSGLLALSQRLIANKQQAYQRYLLQDSALSHRLCIVIGARGVGKTTLLIQRMLETVQGNVTSDKILYVPVDHFLLQ